MVEIKWDEKYEHLGVTPEELYLRQTGQCHLVVIKDIVEGETVGGDLYCTDDKMFAPTRLMLNPSYECCKCMASFIMDKELTMENKLPVTKEFVNLLSAVSNARKYGSEASLLMNSKSLDAVDSFLQMATIASGPTAPLRVTASAELRLFGLPVVIDEDIPDNVLRILPSGTDIVLELP